MYKIGKLYRLLHHSREPVLLLSVTKIMIMIKERKPIFDFRFLGKTFYLVSMPESSFNKFYEEIK